MNFTQLQEILNLQFKDKQLLLNAFVHRSYLNEHKDFDLASNERLEYLGDACLELVVSEYLYQSYPQESEGVLTNFRSALVNTNSLAETAQTLKLGDLLLLSKGEEESGGRTSDNLLANTFEALLGACYLEAGIEICREIVLNLLLPKLKGIVDNELYRDAKSLLQELAQESVSITPQYKILAQWGPDHNKLFRAGSFIDKEMIGVGEGSSKQKAELAAAQDALAKWAKRM